MFLFFLLPITITSKLKWLNEVSGYNQFDSENGYSGILNKPITAIRISGNLPYRVHIKDGNWLPPVRGYSKEKSQEDYAGNGKIIDCISVKDAKYMVHVMGGDWLPQKSKYNIFDIKNGFSGIYGKAIDAIMINGRTYQVGINDDFNNDLNDNFNYDFNNKNNNYNIFNNLNNDLLQYYNENCSNVYYKSGNQEFIKCGTGLKGVDYQWNVKGMQFACTFLCCCVIGGLGNMEQFIEAREWAIENNFIEDVTTHVKIDYLDLAFKISEKFHTVFHSNWTVAYVYFHTFVKNENGEEIFNAA
jgi:hypothetical protein